MQDLVTEFAQNRKNIPMEFIRQMEDEVEDKLPVGIRVLEDHELRGDLLPGERLYETRLTAYPTKSVGVGLLEYLSVQMADGV